MKKRNALRQSFLITVTAAALAAPVACTNEVSLFTEDDDDINPPGCPLSQPSGACDDDGLTCKYGSGCEAQTVVCASGQWVSDDGRPNCGCPASVPEQGSACFNEGTLCGYGADGVCGFPEQEAECRDGQWSTWFNSCNPPPPFECPQALPTGGTSCDDVGWGQSGSCSYTEETPCGPQEVRADCNWDEVALGMMWTVEAPECKSKACDSYGHKDLCDADAGCRWLVPGCGSGTETVAPEGCYPIDDCTPDSCSGGLSCATAVHDPCAYSLCNACAMQVNICLAVPDTDGG